MIIRPHWTTEIRRAVTKHFYTAAKQIPIYLFVGEDQKHINQASWAELKVQGPYYTSERDDRTIVVNLQVRIGCAINTQAGENIYEITDILGEFASAASGNILVLGIANPNFCLNSFNIRSVEQGFVKTKVPLKVGFVEADYSGKIEEERIIEV